MRNIRLTEPSLLVLHHLVTHKDEVTSGADLIKELGLGPGSTYVILHSFEEAGWVKSRQERKDPHKIGRPLRFLYKLTKLGQIQAMKSLSRLQLGK